MVGALRSREGSRADVALTCLGGTGLIGTFGTSLSFGDFFPIAPAASSRTVAETLRTSWKEASTKHHRSTYQCSVFAKG